MKAPLPMEDYLEGAGTTEAREAMDGWLQADPARAEEALAQQRVDRLLASLLRPAAARARLADSIQAALSAAPVEAVQASILAEFPANQQVRSRWRPAFVWAAAACLLLGGLAGWWGWSRPTPAATEYASVRELAGSAWLVRDGATRPLSRGAALRPGDAVETAPDGRALLQFAEGASLDLAGAGRLESRAQTPAHFALHRGSLRAQVQPRPGQPLWRIETPQAVIEVVGTRFHIHVLSEATRIAVDDGEVRLRHRDDDRIVPLTAGQFAIVAPGMELLARPITPARAGLAEAPPALLRDKFLWPFAADSPWNRPLGRNARYQPIRTPGIDLAAELRGGRQLRLVLRELLRAPAQQIVVDGRPAGSVRMLPGLPLPPAPGAIISFVDPATGAITELLQPRWLADGRLEARGVARSSARGPGFLDDGSALTASGASALGGVLRSGELSHGLRHALALNIPRSALGGPAVWPARPGLNAPRGSGNLALGSLLALPPDLDLATLGLGTSGPAYELARALQDYGAYVADCSLPGVRLAVAGNVPPDLEQTLIRLLPHLQVVTNHTPETPGGGGDPRRPAAPPLDS